MKLATIVHNGKPTPIAVTEWQSALSRGAGGSCGASGSCDLGEGKGYRVTSLFDPQPVAPDTPLAMPSAQSELSFTAADLLPVVPNPGKIFCVGLNYREHIEEMGHPVPEHPTLFVKYADALARPFAEVTVPAHMSQQVDYEGELAVIIGSGGAIAGYAVMNDFSQRDWQYRTQQWLQGKNLDASSGFGPWLTTVDEFDPVAQAAVLRTWVNGELRQEHSVADLVFSPQELVDYINQFTTLKAGDVIVTGTPEGVGHGMTPPRYLTDGDEVRIAIDGLGDICNRVRVAN